MQFLRIILILIIIYYLGRLIFRLVFPYLFQGYINRRTGNSSDKQRYSKKNKKKKEGEITIDYINKKNKKFSKDKGEYIDFKEVK